MPQIILKERTAHLASNTYLQETLINVKTCHFHSSIKHQEHFFHRTYITSYFCPVNITKFFRTAFLYTSRSSPLQMFFKIGVLKSFANFTGKHLRWSLLFFKTKKDLQAQGLKKALTQLFSCEVYEILKNSFIYITPPVTVSGPPVAASVFF